MFQGIKNTANALGNVNKLKQQQSKMQAMLQDISVSGVSKNGKVTVTVTGEQKTTKVKIDPELIKFAYENYVNTDSLENQDKGQKLIGDAVIEATNDAVSKVQMEMVKKMQENGGLQEMMGMLKDMQ